MTPTTARRIITIMLNRSTSFFTPTEIEALVLALDSLNTEARCTFCDAPTPIQITPTGLSISHRCI